MKNQVVRRTTPVKKRPACEFWPTAQMQNNPYIKVYNQAITEKGEIVSCNNGLLLIRYDNGLSILRFVEDPDGSVRWLPRSVRSKDKKKIIYIYDRIDVSNKMVPLLIKGLQDYMALTNMPENITQIVLEKRKTLKQEKNIADLAGEVFGLKD